MATVGVAFRTILLAMKQTITDAGIIPDGDCFVAVRMNPPAVDDRDQLVIVPLYQTALPETQEGHGRCGTFKKARINVYFRHSTGSDQTYQDDVWALADDGYYAMIDKLEDAFDLWMPFVSAGKPMLREPGRLVMDNEPRKNYKDHTFGEGMIELEVIFQALRTIS